MQTVNQINTPKQQQPKEVNRHSHPSTNTHLGSAEQRRGSHSGKKSFGTTQYMTPTKFVSL